MRELSEEEKQMIILSEDFQRFMDRAGRIMERALAETVDIYTDYSGAEGDEGLLVSDFPPTVHNNFISFILSEMKNHINVSL